MQVGKFDNENDAKNYLKEIVKSGKALEKFRELIKAQGGDDRILDDYKYLPQAKFKVEVPAQKDGHIQKIDAYNIAYACKLLGAGREKKTDDIDYSVGIYLNKKSGEECKKGETLYTIYSNDEEKTKLAHKYADEAFTYSETPFTPQKMIYDIIR